VPDERETRGAGATRGRNGRNDKRKNISGTRKGRLANHWVVDNRTAGAQLAAGLRTPAGLKPLNCHSSRRRTNHVEESVVAALSRVCHALATRATTMTGANYTGGKR